MPVAMGFSRHFWTPSPNPWALRGGTPAASPMKSTVCGGLAFPIHPIQERAEEPQLLAGGAQTPHECGQMAPSRLAAISVSIAAPQPDGAACGKVSRSAFAAFHLRHTVLG